MPRGGPNESLSIAVAQAVFEVRTDDPPRILASRSLESFDSDCSFARRFDFLFNGESLCRRRHCGHTAAGDVSART